MKPLTNDSLTGGEYNDRILSQVADFQRQKANDAFLRAGSLDSERQSRINAIDKATGVLRNNVFTFSGNVLAIQSESQSGVLYVTTKDTCTCPAFALGGDNPRYCKHRAAYMLAKSYVGVIAALNDD